MKNSREAQLQATATGKTKHMQGPADEEPHTDDNLSV